MVEFHDSINIGRILLEDGLINSSQFLHALEKRLENGYTVMSNLIDLGFVDEYKIATCLCKHYSIPSIYLAKSDSLYYLLEIVERCRKSQYTFIPLDLIHSIITVGLTDAPDESSLKMIEDITGLRVKMVLLSRDQADKYVERSFSSVQDYSSFEMDTPDENRTGTFESFQNRERRRYPRFNKRLKVKYELNSEYVINPSVNISLCGILMHSSSPAPVDSYLVVRLELPSSYQDLVAVAKVVRVEREMSKHAYMIAMDFYSMDISDKRRLSDYLRTLQY
ncbi:MAG: PilZ domain-containing protein [Candidatus Omnitrophica bacterium]|nr:PilZ domain-containing protein [Candidatus Omnitrophota bacterium]